MILNLGLIFGHHPSDIMWIEKATFTFLRGIILGDPTEMEECKLFSTEGLN